MQESQQLTASLNNTLQNTFTDDIPSCLRTKKRKKSFLVSVEPNNIYFNLMWLRVSVEHAVAQLVEAVRYKPEGRGFDSRWCHWIFSLT